MGKYIGGIVFLVVIVIQLVAQLQKAAKEKEQKRQAGMRPQGRPTVSTRAQTGRSGTPQQSPLSAVRTKAEDLAARRRAQLDELRRRRGGQGRATVSQPAARPSPPTPAYPAPAAAPPRVGPDRGFVSATEKAEKRLQARREAAQRKQEEARRRKMERQVQAVKTRAPKEAAVPQAPPAQSRQRVRTTDVYARREDEVTAATPARRIRALLSNRQSLQTAIILTEVIQPPVSMRER